MRTYYRAFGIMIILLTSQSICIKISDEVLDDGGLDFFVPKNSGIDIKPNSVSFNYPSSTDQDKYQMFSSNYPIQNFNKPADLFVIDAMLGVEIRMTIELENTGSNSSGLFPVRISVEHDEYTKFELMSTTINSPSINPMITGTTENPYLLIKNPRTPKKIIIQTSNIDWLNE